MGATKSRLDNCQELDFNFSLNRLFGCVSNNSLKGMEGDSASPSDVILFDMNGTKYNGRVLDKVFCKLFISNIKDLYNSALRNPILRIDIEPHEAILYEYYIYTIKIKQILDYNINPHFVKVISGKLNINPNDLATYINNKQQVILSRSQILNNIKRNIALMLYPSNVNRPAITDNSNVSINLDRETFVNNNLNSIKYGIIFTEAQSAVRVNNIDDVDIGNVDIGIVDIGKSVKLADILSDLLNNNKLDTILIILFQVLTACYSMYLFGFNHNDLHPGNVWIRKKNREVNEYIINGNSYKLDTDIEVLIYDFDRAECVNNPNDVNKNKFNLQKVVENKDAIKIFSYFINYTISKIRLQNIRNTLLDLYVKDTVEKDNLKLNSDYSYAFRIEEYLSPYMLNRPVIHRIDFNKYYTIPQMLERIRNNHSVIFSNLPSNNIYECDKNKIQNKYTFFINTVFTPDTTSLRANINRLQNENIILFTEKSTLQNENNRLQNEKITLSTQYQTTLQTTIDNHRDLLRQKEQDFNIEKANLNNNCENEKNNLKNTFQEEKKQFKTQCDNYCDGEKQKLKNIFEEEKKQFKTQCDNYCDDEKQKLKNEYKTRCDNSLEEKRRLFDGERQKLRKNFEEEKNKLVDNYKKQIEYLKNKLEEEKLEDYDVLEERLSKDKKIDDLNNRIKYLENKLEEKLEDYEELEEKEEMRRKRKRT